MKNGTGAASSKNLLLKYKPINPKRNSAEGIQISSEEEGGQAVESEVNQ